MIIQITERSCWIYYRVIKIPFASNRTQVGNCSPRSGLCSDLMCHIQYVIAKPLMIWILMSVWFREDEKLSCLSHCICKRTSVFSHERPWNYHRNLQTIAGGEDCERGWIKIFKWGGATDDVPTAHITSESRNSLMAGVRGPWKL